MFKAHLRKEPILTYEESVPKALKKLKPESYMNIMRGTYELQKEYNWCKKNSVAVVP